MMRHTEQTDWDRIAKSFTSEANKSDNGFLDSLPPLQQKRLLTALDALGDVGGKRVLVCGCGKGVETAQLVLRGAFVTTFDLSFGMCGLTRSRLASTHIAELTPVQASFEQMPFQDDVFDLAFGVDILHHLEDVPAGSQELKRVLHANGKSVFIENWSGNPVLMFARTHLAGRFGIPHWGSRAESPLDRDRFQVFVKNWRNARLHFPVMFLFLKMVDNIIIGYLGKRPIHKKDRGGEERFLIWLWLKMQDLDWWLSRVVPESIKAHLSYVCQIEVSD